MKYNPEIHHRRSIRLRGYDYSQSGAYFVTICSFQKLNIFCDIAETMVHVNNIGQIITDVWHEIPSKYPYITCGPFVLMPNHIHGIISIGEHDNVDTINTGAPNIGQIVRTFKAKCSRLCAKLSENISHPLWQRNYHEHIIRNENSYHKIVDYIATNPIRWAGDRYYVA